MRMVLSATINKVMQLAFPQSRTVYVMQLERLSRCRDLPPSCVCAGGGGR